MQEFMLIFRFTPMPANSFSPEQVQESIKPQKVRIVKSRKISAGMSS